MRPFYISVLLILFTCLSVCAQENSISWETIKSSRKGTITIYWFPNNPFGYKDSGELKGIEVDLINGFQKYLLDHYQIDLSIRWIEQGTFAEVINHIKNEKTAGTFGVAGFSFTEERRAFMKFSPSYMSDIAVLVSTPDIPIVRTKEDLRKHFAGTTALTAQGTVLEKDLKQLRDENKIAFKIEYTGASKELIQVLGTRKNSFGYLSLPVYLINLDKGLNNLNRQNFLTKRYEGRGIGLPITSDWDEPLNEYFHSKEYNESIESIIARYVNIDLYHFIETFNPDNEVSLLNKEKDIQQMQLKVQELVIQDKTLKQTYLIIIISIGTVLLLLIAILFRRLKNSHLQLKEQKTEIEAQSDEIKSINDNLEQIIKDRTRELETKNKALEEYAFITAHKLRAPLASILGLVTLIDRMNLSEEDKTIVSHLDKSAKRLDEIVHSIMEAIDDSDRKD